MCLRYSSDAETARTIVNDGFLKVFKNLDKYSGTGSLKGWIKRIVFNAMSDHFRKEKKYINMIVLDDHNKIDGNAPEAPLYYEDILKIVDQLNYTTREVFKFYAIDGYTHKEIGELLDISEGNSKWHLHKARKILQEMITKNNKIRRHAG
jgi:RNA polymerase sigma-70 factor (ECF subfamily)